MPDSTQAPEELERDRELVSRLVAGNEEAWAEFDARFGPRIRSAIRSAGIDDGNHDEVSSFVTEALLANDYRRLRNWNRNGSLSAYLYRVSRNLAIDFGRNQLPRDADNHRRFVLGSDGRLLDVADARAADAMPLVPESRFQEARLREAILECLFRMPNGPDREMIIFHYFFGLSAAEIANLSGRRRNAVDQALHRARRSFAAVAAEIHPELVEYLQEG